MPKRIQRRRTKGWRMPAATVYVGRPTKYGNPMSLGDIADVKWRERVLEAFKEHVKDRISVDSSFLGPLRGKDLACWCPVGTPCHADILLEMANK